MIDRLIAALRAPELGLDLDWRDLADVLWLATTQHGAQTQRQPSGIAEVAPSTQTGAAEQAEAAGPSATGENPVILPPPSIGAPRSWSQQPGGEAPRTRVRFGARDEPGLGLDVEAPVRHALADRESIGRALRPFMRRRPSLRRREFDPDATVSQFCDTGVLAPVMRRAREHWFDVALVIDDGPTLVVWQETAAALGDLLERHGAFRAVTRWHLGRDASGQVCLRTPGGRQHSPSALDDATDPSIVLVLTDCVDDLWSGDSGWSMLRDWGRTRPVAILQPLPERAWSHTWMGDADIAVRSHRPGQANATLERSQPWWWDSDEPLTGVVPVVTLSADSVGPWADMVMGTPGVAVRALSGRADDQASPLSDVLVDNATPIPRLAELLRSGLSSTAYELAIHLSAVDLSLPIAHIVMDRVLPQAREQHLAELLVSGVLRVQGDGTRLPDATNTAVSLEFPGRVRETLQQSLTTTVALSVWRALVPHLEATGQQPRFSLVLEDAATLAGAGGDLPDKTSEAAATEMLRIAAQVAARLGFEQQASPPRARVPTPAPDMQPHPAREDTRSERPDSTEGYLEFDVAITRERPGYAAHVVSSPVGEASASFTLPFAATELAQFMIAVGPPRVASERPVPAAVRARSVKDYGRKLGDALLTGPVLEAFTASLEAARSQGQDLRVRLRLDAVPELDPVPWEYLYDSRLERFLTLSQETPVVRLLDSLQRPPPVTVEAPLRVLVVISNPSDMPELAVDWEKQLLLAATADMVKSGQLAVTVLDTATLTELQRALLGDYHVFHFIGHGGFDDDAQEGVLVLEKDDGTSHVVSGARLGTLLHDARNMQLAVLNAGEGARTSGRDAFSGVGQALVRQGLPAVVAMQTEISDRAALVFSHEFYWFITAGLPIEAVMCEVRKAMADSDEASEWGTAVLLRSNAEQPFAFVRLVSNGAPAQRGQSLDDAAQAAIAADAPNTARPILEQLAAERPDYGDAPRLSDEVHPDPPTQSKIMPSSTEPTTDELSEFQGEPGKPTFDAGSSSVEAPAEAPRQGLWRRIRDAFTGRARDLELPEEAPTSSSSESYSGTSKGTRSSDGSTQTFAASYSVSGQHLELHGSGLSSITSTSTAPGVEPGQPGDSAGTSIRDLMFGSEDEIVRAIDYSMSADAISRDVGPRELRSLVTRTAEQVGKLVSTLTSKPVSEVLVGGWRQHEGLLSAAKRTMGLPPTTETAVVDTHEVVWSVRPSITVTLDGLQVATMNLDITLELTVEGLELSLARGQVTGVLAGRGLAHIAVSTAGNGGKEVVYTERSTPFSVRDVLSLGEGVSLLES